MSLLHRLAAKLDAALHQFEKLDLGYTYDEMYPTPCGIGNSTDKKTQYPNLYVNRTKGDVMDIPETGKAVVEYVLTGRNMSKRDGKTTYGMDLQIKSFDPQGTKKADAKMKKEGMAVEMRDKTGRVIALVVGGKFYGRMSQFSDRTRNGDGQFVGNVTGGADPVTMRQAYGEKPKRSLLAPGVGAAALAGAGLLGGTAKGRGMLAGGLRKVEGLARTGRDKLQGRVRMSKPGRGKHREQMPGLGEVIYRSGKSGRNYPVSGD